MRTHFLSNDPLGDDPIARVLLEFLVRNSLGFSRLFEFFHRLQIHLLAHFVEALDQFCVARNAQVLALLQKELLVDQVAENVALLFRDDPVGARWVLLLRFLLELVATAGVFRARNDLVINAGNNLFDYGIGRQDGRQQHRTCNCQQ